MIFATRPDLAYAKFSAWIYDQALPFWATVGTDPAGFGFVEHLDVRATPASVDYKRVRVQARQIYVFSHAALLGWDGGMEIAARGYRFLTDHGWNDGVGWARRLGRQGGIIDPTADLYDYAFVLFAFAWYARATNSDEPIHHAHRTLCWIQDHMAAPSGGFYNTIPVTNDSRQQNPHMHMLEAMLALYELTGDPKFRAVALDLFELFRTQFFDVDTGTLGEFFNHDWSMASGSAGSHIEPGHHYEWVWLLNQVERLTGQSTRTEAKALYAFANKFGQDRNTGLIYDVVDRRGTTRDRSIRLWPQTEALKAHIAAKESGFAGPEIGRNIDQIIDNLLTHFLMPAPKGTWIDHLNADFTPKSDKIPSSSFYHIFMAFGELARTTALT